MEQGLQDIFILEIKNQCFNSLKAAKAMENELNNPSSAHNFFYHAQSFLVFTANISKLLWGTSDNYSRKREDLRKSLGIKNNSQLRSRTLRNLFEHFDENLEKWFKQSNEKNYIDLNVGPTNFVEDMNEKDLLRNYNTDDHSITYRGKRFNIIPIVKEVEALYNRL
ncbi:hypothetical protein CHI07_17170 [Paenibacillus sp. 7884-2]|nr:hypothetical protein CHI07_17170 [Paenibacillus sp. 7884-2]